MIRAERIWRMQRLSGRVAMLLLGLALLALFDGLRGGILGSTGLADSYIQFYNFLV